MKPAIVGYIDEKFCPLAGKLAGNVLNRIFKTNKHAKRILSIKRKKRMSFTSAEIINGNDPGQKRQLMAKRDIFTKRH